MPLVLTPLTLAGVGVVDLDGGLERVICDTDGKTAVIGVGESGSVCFLGKGEKPLSESVRSLSGDLARSGSGKVARLNGGESVCSSCRGAVGLVGSNGSTSSSVIRFLAIHFCRMTAHSSDRPNEPGEKS